MLSLLSYINHPILKMQNAYTSFSSDCTHTQSPGQASLSTTLWCATLMSPLRGCQGFPLPVFAVTNTFVLQSCLVFLSIIIYKAKYSQVFSRKEERVKRRLHKVWCIVNPTVSVFSHIEANACVLY